MGGPNVVVLPDLVARQAIASGHAQYLRFHRGSRPASGILHLALRDRVVG